MLVYTFAPGLGEAQFGHGDLALKCRVDSYQTGGLEPGDMA